MKVDLFRQGGAVALVAGLTVGVILLAPGPAAAGGQDSAPVATRQAPMAEARVFAGGMDLAPNVRYAQAILTVSGGGGVFRRVIEAGAPLEIGLFDPEGEVLADGSYGWELRLVPDEATAKRLRAMARAGKETADAWPSEAGSFVVRGGVIDVSVASEQEPVRVADRATESRGLTTAAKASRLATRVSRDGDEAVAASEAEPGGLDAQAARTLSAAALPANRSPESAAARATSVDNDENVTASGVVRQVSARAATAAPEIRRFKYSTPDSQGRPTGATKDRQ